MFDLTSLTAPAKRNRRRLRRIFALLSIPFFAIWFGLLAIPRILGHLPFPAPFGWWLVSGVLLSVPVVLIFMGPVIDSFNPPPKWISVDSRGVTVNSGESQSRTWQWKDARSWLELVDNTHAVDVKWAASCPSYFCLRSLRGLSDSFWIPEPAARAILETARAQGVEPHRQVGGRHMDEGSVIYYERNRTFL
jgi:hypothetical protein